MVAIRGLKMAKNADIDNFRSIFMPFLTMLQASDHHKT